MGNYGGKVTRDGYDVATAGILDQSFNSQKNCLKIGLEGSASSTASGSRTVEITHGLGLTPGFLIWFQVSSSGKWYPGYMTEDISGKNGNVSPSSDGTKLYLAISTNASATVEIYYVIFIDPGDWAGLG